MVIAQMTSGFRVEHAQRYYLLAWASFDWQLTGLENSYTFDLICSLINQVHQKCSKFENNHICG
jgi:hypothetical protein